MRCAGLGGRTHLRHRCVPQASNALWGGLPVGAGAAARVRDALAGCTRRRRRFRVGRAHVASFRRKVPFSISCPKQVRGQRRTVIGHLRRPDHVGTAVFGTWAGRRCSTGPARAQGGPGPTAPTAGPAQCDRPHSGGGGSYHCASILRLGGRHPPWRLLVSPSAPVGQCVVIVAGSLWINSSSMISSKVLP